MADIRRIKVGTASCGLAAGAADVLDAFKRLAGNTPVVEVGCIGHCYAEPMVEVELNDGTSVFYSSVKGDDKSVNSILALRRRALPDPRGKSGAGKTQCDTSFRPHRPQGY